MPHMPPLPNELPPDSTCSRCNALIYQVHPDPKSFAIVCVYSPLVGTNVDAICSDCLLSLGEFLCPELMTNPEWISEHDQWEAEMRESGRRNG